MECWEVPTQTVDGMGQDCCEVPTNEMKKYSCTIQLVGNFGSKKVFSKLFLFDCVSFFMLKDWSKSV